MLLLLLLLVLVLVAQAADVAAVWTVALLLPTLAVGCRRLHDTNRSGWWWLLYYFCCIVGAIVVIIFWIGPSTPGPNRYGDGPATAP